MECMPAPCFGMLTVSNKQNQCEEIYLCKVNKVKISLKQHVLLMCELSINSMHSIDIAVLVSRNKVFPEEEISMPW